MKTLRYILYGLAAVCILVMLVVTALIFFVQSESFSGWASQRASDTLGREVRLENALRIHAGKTTRIIIRNLAVANVEEAKEPYMLKAERLEFAWRPLSLLKGKLVLPEVVAVAPEIHLMRDEDGNGNWEFTKNPAGAVATAPVPEKSSEMPVIGRLIVENGKLSFQDKKAGMDVQLQVASLRGKAQEADRIRLHGGGTYNKKPFKLDFTGGSMLALRENEEPYPLKADIRVGNTRVELEGTADDIVQMSGLDIAMKISGEDAKELYDFAGIVFPPTPPYTLQGQLGRTEDEWRFSTFKGRMGESDLSGDIVWDTSRERPLLRGNFQSNNLDIKDLGGLIGATPGDAEGEHASEAQKEAAEIAEASPYLIPDTSLDISKLRAMDADVVFNAQRIKAPALLDKLHMTLKLDNGVLTLAPIRFEMADGKIEGNLAINGRKTPPHTIVDITVTRLSLERLLTPVMEALRQENVSQGYLGGKIKLAGDGLSMREMLGTSEGMVGVGMEGGQLSTLLMELMGIDIFQGLGFFIKGDSPTPIHCVIADFAVENGVLHTERLVIDTKDTHVVGEGSIVFQTEEIDMVLTPYPKDPSLFSARSPIRLGGTLKEVKVRPSLANLGIRGGAAIALGAILPPLAILAFIEPGLGEDSDCAHFVEGLQQKTEGAIPANPE